MTDGVADGLTVGAVAIAVVGLWLAFLAHRHSRQTTAQLDTVRGLTESAEQSVKALSESAADQSVSLAELVYEVEALSSFAGDLLRVVQDGGGEEEALPGPDLEDEEELASSPLMAPVPADMLDLDIRTEVEREAGATVEWALRRRGAGVPRWLIGTEDGKAWRATRWRGVNVDRALSAAAERAVTPASLDDLPPDASAALERMLLPDEQVEALLRRLTRGVPVYFATTDQGRVLRLVNTRWGWGGAAESPGH